ncbi:aldose 1-epimerase family protein [Limosilactobacillus kribbianus]|uniref:aldose 1-epimerase family protein n=1 Tax=Limosilactobacillus kribbianus TaxID=2982695 RepID=UPI0022640513|nr:aldose 1-epimerase family protein [Limosilactobacillus kribbianus]
MQKIENDVFSAEIDEHGAQLTHLVNKKADFDYIWNGKEWGKHAPVLFPAIGRSNQDKYVLDGKTYEMPQHGFVSDQDFTVSYHTPNALALQLVANDETKALYPFDFKLTVVFTLLSTGLSVSFTVENDSDREMPYSLGSHPAFNVPINGDGKFADYQVQFTGLKDPIKVYEIVKTPNPYRTGKEEELAGAKDGKLTLNYDVFKPGLRIISNPGIKSVKLSSAQTTHAVEMDVSQFKNLCLWTKEDLDCKFLCMEPFDGLPDVLGEPVDWMEKPGNEILPAHSSKVSQYEMHLS